MLFDSWYDLWRVIAGGLFGYAVIVAGVRVTGKRTLAKMNAFDLTVTVALGSTLATIVLSDGVSLSDGAVAILVLLGAQWVVSWTSVRSQQVRKLTRGEPTVVFRRGRFDDEALRATRVLRTDVEQSIRSSGFGDLELVAAVVLEAEGTLSVFASERCGCGSALPGTEPRSGHA